MAPQKNNADEATDEDGEEAGFFSDYVLAQFLWE